MSDDIHDQIVEDIAGLTHDPLGFSLYAYDWGNGELSGVNGPRQWQGELLQEIGEHLQNPATRYQPLLISRASGHGIGKSATMGMVVNWGLSTCEDCKIVITANTDTQLRTKTWPEISKWFGLAINKDWFNVTATAVISADKQHSKAWRADAVPWSEHNTEAFAGLHNKGKRIIVIFDEASNIADRVWEVTEGALTDEDTEIIWLAFGNPTRNTGRFRECFRKFRHRWKSRQIDSRTVEGTNKEQISKWIEDYGEDSDFVKVRVRGLFPSASDLQFIPQGYVDTAMARRLRPEEYNYAPVIIGVDPAYTGSDEASIYLRQGLYSRLLGTYKITDDDVKFAEIIARFEDEHKADAVFIDFGYGTGIHSIGKSWGRKWRLVNFASESVDKQMLNKRGEIWNSLKSWLKEGGSIDDQQTADELIAPEYKVRLDGKIVIESKEDMKKRGIPSPNRADALAITFAYPVVKDRPKKQRFAKTEYNLFGG